MSAHILSLNQGTASLSFKDRYLGVYFSDRKESILLNYNTAYIQLN